MTDWKFLIQAVNEWMYVWRKRNWTRSGGHGQPLKNAVDFRSLDRALQKFQMNIEFEYLQAHSEGNDEADALAKNGAHRYIVY